ncbi:MAG: DUF1116 domain-containing protein [Casimicrobiaceae bacterium]
MDRLTVLHAGPPIKAAELVGPMRGAVIGGLVYEGVPREEATDLLERGRICLRPCHDYGFVGPMAGIVTASMPVWVAEDATYKHRSYSTLNEGLGPVLRFGANGEEVIARLRWMQEVAAPLLDKALRRRGPLELKDFLAEGLGRGDELHNRNKSSTSSFVRELAPHIAAVGGRDAEAVFDFLRRNDHFCLNISIAASKCSAIAAHDAGTGSVVTVMAANGREFGIKVSGLGDQWFTAPANRAKGNFLAGYTSADAACDMGDSYISEVVGLGGFAMAAAPAIAAFVGGKPSQFASWTDRMYQITLAEHEQFRIPALDYRGTPLGIEVGLVLKSGVLPVLNSGIAHKDAGVGQVGAGITHPPARCFELAEAELARKSAGRPGQPRRASAAQ